MIRLLRLVGFLSFLLVTTAYSQQRRVTIAGRVLDSATQQPLRFVSIRLPNVKPVFTNALGEFSVTTSTSSDSIRLVAALFGYHDISLFLPARDTTLSILKHPQTIRSAELVVSAEDPAVRIMRRVLSRKELQENTLKSYSYMLYTKFVANTDTTTALRSSNRGDTTIVSILESISKGYYKAPSQYFNEIIQRRQTVNVPPQANFVAFGTNLNIYDDVVTILGEEIESPFHTKGLNRYSYKLMSDNDDDIVQIDVAPMNSQRKGFVGSVFVDQRSNIPVEVRLQPTESVNLPFDADLSYWQTLALQDSIVLPLALSIESSLEASLLWVYSPRLDVRIETRCYDYRTNVELEDGLFEQKRVELSPTAEKFDSAYWASNVSIPLKPEEQRAYRDIDNFFNNPDSLQNSLLDRYFAPIRSALAKLRRRPFTGFDDIVRYNSIHGLYLGIGLRDQLTKGLSAQTNIGYGLSDRVFYGSAYATLALDELDKWNITAGYFDELLRRDDPNIVRPSIITFLTALTGRDYGDYYYSKGYSSTISYAWGQQRFLGGELFVRPNAVALRYTSALQSSATTADVWHLLPMRDSVRSNPTIAPGLLNTLSADVYLNYAPIRRIANTGLALGFETAQAALFGGDHTFSRLTWNGLLRTRTLPLWSLDISCSGQWSWGAVPPQRFISTESGFNGLAVGNSFRGMKVKEFYGDRAVILTMSHNFGEVIPGVFRIPNIASFGLEFILFGGAAWTSFSDATKAMYAPSLPSTNTTADRLYYDVGFSINRLLIFLRLDINARLSQRTTPEFRFTISNALF